MYTKRKERKKIYSKYVALFYLTFLFNNMEILQIMNYLGT